MARQCGTKSSLSRRRVVASQALVSLLVCLLAMAVASVPEDVASSANSASAAQDSNVIRVPINVNAQDVGSLSSSSHSVEAGVLHSIEASGSESNASIVAAHNASSMAAWNSTSMGNSTSNSSSMVSLEPVTTIPANVEIRGVPSNPTGVAAVAFDGCAEVSWKPPEDDGSDPITAYELGWMDEETHQLVGTQLVTPVASSVTLIQNGSVMPVETAVSAVATSVIVANLANGRSYTFKVRAKNLNGFSTWSAKSLAVSPLHPPDLCGRLSCSGHGTCFPDYHANAVGLENELRHRRWLQPSTNAQCICRPGYNPPDCSVKSDAKTYVWTVTEWTVCSSGCGGGKRTREALCWDVETQAQAPADTFCDATQKPVLTGICNGMECGSKLVSIKYEVEMSYDEVLFSPEAVEAFEQSFTTEVAAALQIPRTRLEITALKRGSIVVYFQVLPASRAGEKSLNAIVDVLQSELGNASSTLRSKGTFARRVEPNNVKLSFSLADQTVAGGAEDISVLGLIGTVLVLCFFVSTFGWFLRKRHERILRYESSKRETVHSPRPDMKRMGIRTMT